MSNFDSKNEAASIHFRQLHRLFPSRKIANGQTHPLSYHQSQFSLDGLDYRYQGETKSVNRYLERMRATGLLVIRDGEIQHESYYHGSGENSTFIAFSTTKSIVSLLVGLAISDGLIKDVYDPITDYLPELKGSGFDGATIKQVLQMTTALSFPGENIAAGGEGRDIRGASVRSLSYGTGGMRSQPQQAMKKAGAHHGDTWTYTNTNTHIHF